MQNRDLTLDALADNTTPFINRAFEQALEYQYLREALKNAEEAGATQFIVEPDWVHLDQCEKEGREPVYRLSMWDDGKGMDEDRLYKFHKLFFSEKDMAGHHANYGMGVKIASIPCNPHGFIVMSWQGGVGNMIRYVRNTETGKYGLRRHEVVEDGVLLVPTVIPTPPEYDVEYVRDGKGTLQRTADGAFITKPREHGTLIIFTGDRETVDTYLAPPNVDGGKWRSSHRVNSYVLNSRFGRFRSGMVIRVYETASRVKYRDGRRQQLVWARNRGEATSSYNKETLVTTGRGHVLKGEGRRGTFRTVVGAEDYFDTHSSHHGVIATDACTYRWYICDRLTPQEFRDKKAVENRTIRSNIEEKLDEDDLYDTHRPNREGHSPYAPPFGMIAVAYQGRDPAASVELYNTSTETDSNRFAQFGVYGDRRERVVILVEPKIGESTGVYPNDVRSELKSFHTSGGQIPWSEWGANFIRALTTASHTDAGAKAFLAFLNKEGEVKAIGQDVMDRIQKQLDDIAEQIGLRSTRKSPTRVNKEPEPVGDLDDIFGDPEEEEEPKNDPPRLPRTPRRGRAMPKWTLIPVDLEPDPVRLATWNSSEKEVKIFLGHRAFRERKAHWMSYYGHVPTAEVVISNVLAEVFAVHITTSVASALSYKDTEPFDDEQFARLVSDEAVTMAGLGVWLVDAQVKQRLTGALKTSMAPLGG